MRYVLLIPIIGLVISNPQFGWAEAPIVSPVAAAPPQARHFATTLMVAASQETMLLPDLIEEALRRSPQILAAKSRWKAARAKIAQAWDLKRPWASYDFMGSEVQTRSGPQEYRFGVSQEIPFPTKLPMRSRAAKLVAMRAEHHVFHIEQLVRTEVVAAYAELLWAQQALEVLKTERGTLEQISATIQARYATGQRSAADAAKTEVEIARLAERTLVVGERRVAAEEQLNVLLDQPRTAPWPLLRTPPTPELPFTREELIQLALKHRHSLVIARLTAKEQHAQYRLAQMEYLPDIEVGFSYTEIGGGTTTRSDDGDNAWMIPIRISLPFWEPQIRGQIREARSNKEAAEQDLEHAVNLTRAEVVDRYTQYRAARERIGVYEATWLPQAELALASTQAAYQAGRGAVLDVLDSERMVLEAKLGYWQSLADTLSAYAALEQAVGIPFETVGRAGQEG